MKRLIIIGEGQTEQAFCHDVLQPYFTRFNVLIQNPTIKKSKGGIVDWRILKREITNHLQVDHSAIVSMLIDYYGIHEKHGFPRWTETLGNDGKITAPSKRLTRIITGYQKTVFGPLLAGEIGLAKIRAKCPRFNHWIEKLSRI
jgi:hypothetical protein